MSAPTTRTVQLVWDRDQGRCAKCGVALVGARGLSWSVHHRRPRSMGGTSLKWVNMPANLILLCGSGTTGCHGHIESHRAAARASGLLISAHERRKACEVPMLHALFGEVLIDDYGGKTSQEVAF